MPETLTKKWLIVCEGGSDKGVFSDLIAKRGLSHFQIAETGGINKLGTYLRQISLSEGFIKHVEAILIIADNDDDPPASFRYVQSQIRGAGYTAPDVPLRATDAVLPIVVLMMPWTNETGTLETMCMGALYAKWKGIKKYLDVYMAGTPAGKWGQSRQSKMRMQCVLSATCKEDPNTPLNWLFSRNKIYHFSTRHRCFAKITKFLKEFDKTIEPKGS